MIATNKPLYSATAGDLMTYEIIEIPETMPLREAAKLLLENQVGGAPVVDSQGRCVGVLSAADFLRLINSETDIGRLSSPPLPITCAYFGNTQSEDGSSVNVCSLPWGVCPIQHIQSDESGNEQIQCLQPHSVLVDWQIVQLEKLPNDQVSRFMTAGPVTTRPDANIRELARLMINAHIHRIIVVNDMDKPIGVVSSTDLLIALAYCDRTS